MPANPLVPLIPARVPVGISLCDIKSPQDIVDLITDNVNVDSQAFFDALNSGIVFSATEPTGDNKGKLWVKTTGGGVENPRGVGIVVDGNYVIIPIPADADIPEPVPTGLVALLQNGTTIPEGWTTFSGPTPPTGLFYIIKST